MRRWVVTLILLFAPALVSAQSEYLVGKRIRAKLSGPEGPWAVGVVTETHADSLTMLLADRTAIRLRTADVTVEVADGYQTGRGFAFGAIIGGVAAFVLMSSALDGEGGELASDLLVIASVPVGAAVGGAIGFGGAAQRWRPVSTGTLPCGGWRMGDGSVRSEPLVTRGPRSRRRGALIGGAILGGIGLVGGLTDSQMPTGEVPGVVVGNFLFGALVGSFFGPREKVVVPASCP